MTEMVEHPEITGNLTSDEGKNDVLNSGRDNSKVHADDAKEERPNANKRNSMRIKNRKPFEISEVQRDVVKGQGLKRKHSTDSDLTAQIESWEWERLSDDLDLVGFDKNGKAVLVDYHQIQHEDGKMEVEISAQKEEEKVDEPLKDELKAKEEDLEDVIEKFELSSPSRTEIEPIVSDVVQADSEKTDGSNLKSPERKMKSPKNEKSNSTIKSEDPVPSEAIISTPVSSVEITQTDKPATADYALPFNMGWKREVVMRAIKDTKDSSSNKGDVYYISPSGKKCRSRHEIIQQLTGDLTIDNFCFKAVGLGQSTDKEVIRNAKGVSRRPSPVETVRTGKRISKPKGAKGASPPPQGWTPAKALKTSTSSPRVSSTPKTPVSVHHHHETGSKNTSTSKSHSSSSRSATKSSKGHSPSQHNDVASRKKPDNVLSIPSSNGRTGSSKTFEQSAAAGSSSSALVPAESFAVNFFGNVSLGYDVLLHTFQYLKVQELLRAACVCRIWNLVANHRTLWKTVRMKNSQVNDWAGFAATLRRNETHHLDLRKMLLSSTSTEEMRTQFLRHLGTVVTLESIDLCRCPSQIVEGIFLSNPDLRIVNARTIADETLNLQHLVGMQHLEELRLKTTDFCNLDGDLSPLSALKNLKYLSLTIFKNLASKNIAVIGELVGLKSLEIGECNQFNEEFAENVLPKLTQLQRLRLEKGQDNCCTLEILDSISKMPNLVQLEMVNFDIKPGFDQKLAQCKNIRKLLLIPTYVSQSATTNQIILKSILHSDLCDTLRTFNWGVTLELLRVTAQYVVQYEDKKRNIAVADQRIPVLKPVPGLETGEPSEEAAASDEVLQIAILPLDEVEQIFSKALVNSKTKFKIIKIPFTHTWKQNLVE